MNGFRIWALQDLSYILPTKSLQHETHMPANTFKRCLSNFLNFYRKQESVYESRRINLTTKCNNLNPICTTWMALLEITTTIFSSRSPTYFLLSKTNTEVTRPEALKSLIKYEELLDGNSDFRSKYYKMLSNGSADDFDFICNDSMIQFDKIYDDCTSKRMFTLQESQESKINRTIDHGLTNNLSIYNTAKNVNSSFPVKSKLKISEIKQQSRDRLKLQDNQNSRKYSSQSLEVRNYTQKDLFPSITKQRIQQQSQISRCVLQTPTIIFKPSLFEILQRSNTVMETQGCTKTAAKTSPFANIEIPRNISSKWFSMKQSCPRRRYHTWKTSKIENMIKYDDHRFFVPNTLTMRQEQSMDYRLSRSDQLTYFRNSGNQGSRKSSSYLPSVPRRTFSSKSCTVIQQSTLEFENSRKDLSSNASIVRLRSTRSHPDRVSLVQSFSCDASKSKRSTDCEKNDKSQRSKCAVKKDDLCSQEVATSQIKSKETCGKTRRKDTCVSSEDDVYVQRERKSKFNNNYVCPELKRQKPCRWDEERCPETRRKYETKARVSSRDRARQSRNSSYSQKQGWQSKLYKQREDCKKTDESPAICKESIKRRDCKPKCEKQRVKCNEKVRRKCTGNDRKRSNSCGKRNSSRASDKRCSKVDGKRHYSQQSIFSVSRDRKSFSTLIPDIFLGTNVNKRFYASCSKDKKDRKQSPSCEKRKVKCGKEQEETPKKCVKGPAKCTSRKKAIDKKQTCQSTKKSKDEKLYESMKKSREEFCTSRKKEFIKDEKLKKESMKILPPPTRRDKKPMEQSIKQQIDREYKEIDECKKCFKKEKKDKVKMVSTEHKPTGLNRTIISCKEEQKKDSEKFASTYDESIISTDTVFKWLNTQSRIINGKIPISAKDVRLFNVMFDRSFSTAKLDYQADFAIERTMNDDKMAQNCSANSDDFIHGDELPNYVEIEYEDEEDDTYD